MGFIGGGDVEGKYVEGKEPWRWLPKSHIFCVHLPLPLILLNLCLSLAIYTIIPDSPSAMPLISSLILSLIPDSTQRDIR